MFKFKMLTKVLVAVCLLGQIIEINLNMCIAMSIDLDRPVGTITLERMWQPNLDSSGAQATASGGSGDEEDSDPFILASRAPASTSTSTSTTTTTTTTETTKTTEAPSTGSSDSVQVQQNISLGGKMISQTLESNGRFNYFGKIYMGGQPFMVLFDLTSSAFWLPSSECKSADCISRSKYNRSASATYKDTGLGVREFTYEQTGSTRVSAKIGTDQLIFAGVTIEDQAFGEATEVAGDSFAYWLWDGFLGLGLKHTTSASVVGGNSTSLEQQVSVHNERFIESPLERLHKMGLLKEPIFSLLIKGQVNEYMYSANNGELILGELAPGYRPEDITYVPVTHVDYWEFRLGCVSLRHPYGGQDIERACESDCPAILDTSTTLISGHYTDVDRLNKALGGYDEGSGVYRLSNCDIRLLPDVLFTIGDAEFSLAPEDYVILHRINGNVVSCHSAIKVVSADQYPFWILGEYFLKQHYVVFDFGQKRLGFAKSKSMQKEMGVDIYGRLRRKLHII